MKKAFLTAKKAFRQIPIYFVIYIVAVIAALIYFGVGIYPDRLAVLLLVPILFIGKLGSFLKSWTPFLLFLFAYEYLRGVIALGDPRVNFTFMPGFDQTVFGILPTIWLQQHLYIPGHLSWYDYLLTVVYFLHFAAPLLFAFFLWRNKPSYFKKFVSGFIVLSYGALFTYLSFPAAPPWLASQQGLIPHLDKILDSTLRLFSHSSISAPTVYYFFDANLVAAVPSLHAAYPALISLFAIKFFRGWGLLTLPYTFAVWLMVVYFGEHYVFDVVLGAIYAAAAYALVVLLLPRAAPWIRTNLDPLKVVKLAK